MLDYDLDDLIEGFLLNRWAVLMWIFLGFLGYVLSVLLQYSRDLI